LTRRSARVEGCRRAGAEWAAEKIETSVRLRGYIRRQENKSNGAPLRINRFAERHRLSRGSGGVRARPAERLDRHRPATLGQAGRIAGVNPADIAILQIYLHARSR
jgi:tRNA uridine 5-carboxymethylaminomethyl modification enzyme